MLDVFYSSIQSELMVLGRQLTILTPFWIAWLSGLFSLCLGGQRHLDSSSRTALGQLVALSQMSAIKPPGA